MIKSIVYNIKSKTKQEDQSCIYYYYFFFFWDQSCKVDIIKEKKIQLHKCQTIIVQKQKQKIKIKISKQQTK